jgi:hypothetical protein
MATYSSTQLKGAGVLNIERFRNTGETPAIQIKVTLPGITSADRNHADVGQCTLFIETLNLGTNPVVGDRETTSPFGKNPTVNYMEAGYFGGNFNKNIIAEEGSYGFFPQKPTLLGFEQTITFESLGIQHNLSKVPGSVASPEPLATGPLFERCYLPQITEGRKIAAFTFTNDNTSLDSFTSKIFYWFPSNIVYEYGGEGGEEEFFYGSVRFRGVGPFGLTINATSLIGG